MPALLSKSQAISPNIVCPRCHDPLLDLEEKLICRRCHAQYRTNQYGFQDFILDQRIYAIDSTTEEYAQDQACDGYRIYEDYLKPFLLQESFQRVLDVGCGVGRGISQLLKEGYDAYGIDLPNLARFWAQVGNDPAHFFCCDSVSLPFPGDFFEVIYSTGVIEHIGTEDGNSTLADDYREKRRQFAAELLRVLKPGGRLLISCPNKSFPIDIQHGPGDDRRCQQAKFRNFLFQHAGLNLHRVWGSYHLLSYGETRQLFCDLGGARSFEPLPLRSYFGFGRFKSGFLKPFISLAEFYVNHLPAVLRPTFLNPYMLVQIRK